MAAHSSLFLVEDIDSTSMLPAGLGRRLETVEKDVQEYKKEFLWSLLCNKRQRAEREGGGEGRKEKEKLRLDAGENFLSRKAVPKRDWGIFISRASSTECVHVLVPFAFTDFHHLLFFKSWIWMILWLQILKVIDVGHKN